MSVFESFDLSKITPYVEYKMCPICGRATDKHRIKEIPKEYLFEEPEYRPGQRLFCISVASKPCNYCQI